MTVKMVLLDSLLTASLALVSSASADILLPRQQNATLASCPGYRASGVETTGNGLTATLTLAGTACNVYGTDLEELTLTVEYQSDQRLHVKIQDPANEVYQVPDSVFERPEASGGSSNGSDLEFKYEEDPFSFSVVRRESGEVLFDTSAAQIVFEDQYVRLRTSLPDSPSLYGLGEHSDSFVLNTTNYTRTLWNRDSYRIPEGSNLYGAHPVYYDHRGDNGTHAVFLLNSNGMDIKIDDSDGQFLEYNTIGGIIDLYFVSGPTPIEAAQQYSEVVGKSAMMPYWGFGFHQCRYGMRDVYEVAEVVANYSQAGIPLETMWTDIDYMYQRWVFTLDPERFPLELVRELVDTLHSNDQHYIVMVDPAVAHVPDQGYEAFDQGVDSFLKYSNGSLYKGVVWPGVTVYPDWFKASTQEYWDDQFLTFFDPDTGVDIDALWIDMNEASNFCAWPCLDPEAEAASQGLPPKPPAIRLGSPRPIPGFPDSFQPQCRAVVTFNVNATTFLGENILILGSSITLGNDNVVNAAPLSADTYPIWSASIDMPADGTFTYQYVRSQPDGSFIYENGNRTVTTGDCGSTGSTQDTILTSSPSQSKFKRFTKPARPHVTVQKRQAAGEGVGLPGRSLLDPAYSIENDAGTGVLSDRTIRTDLIHDGGYAEYDTHNLYGAMMSEASRIAMLARRPALRPMIITRSTFAGSGRQVGHWLGDNGAEWSYYLTSIRQLLDFTSLFQFAFAGSDVCGFSGQTTDNICARWAALGAFSPFYRNHREVNYPPHEFYRSELVAESARNAIEIRYKLLDYIYTAMHEQSQSGTPIIQPMFFAYPSDPNANSLEHQYFWGPGVLVAPVTEENSTTANFYLPDDIFYDYYTHETVRGEGATISVPDVPFTSIPLYYKGGNIIALRANSANTTTLLRQENFQLIIAPDLDGNASGNLYLDDGVSLEQESTSYIEFSYDGESSTFTMGGTFDYDSGVIIESITVLGRVGGPSSLVPYQVDLTGPATLEV